MNLNTKILKLALVFIMIGAPASSVAQNRDSVFTSPTGKFVVTFEELRRTTKSSSEDISEVSNIEYRIRFNDRKTNNSVFATFTDVYGSRKPTPVSEIFGQFQWSPGDAFTFLPEEQWPAYPGTPTFTAVNLRPGSQWSTAEVSMSEVVWLDSVTVIGSYGVEDESVVMFDGGLGQSSTIIESAPPLGYRFVNIQGDTIVVESVLNQFASDSVRVSFKPTRRFLKLQRNK